MSDFFATSTGEFVSSGAFFEEERDTGQFAAEQPDIADQMRAQVAQKKTERHRCEVCGGTSFESVDGHLVCQRCGTQTQGYIETEQDEDWVNAFVGEIGQRVVRGTTNKVKEDAQLRDPTMRAARRTTLMVALKVLLNEHVKAMTRPAEEGGRICAPMELKAVVNRIWDAWMKQQFVLGCDFLLGCDVVLTVW